MHSRSVPLLAAAAAVAAAVLAVRAPAALSAAYARPIGVQRISSPSALGTRGIAARTEDDRAIDSLIARMSVREKAAQMVMPWMPGGLEPGSATYRRMERLVASHRVGGIIVGKGDQRATTRSIAALQRRSRVPLLIASDLEWGAGMRLLGASLLPTAMAVAATEDTALAYAHGRVTAAEARAGGLNVALAPVLDVNVNPRNPIINTRSFGSDPRTVARFGASVVRGLQDGGMIAVAKHFPGHGDTEEDSHLALPAITVTRARLDSVELVPFRAAVRAGIGGMMVGHIAAPALGSEDTPASLSRAVITTLLRDQMGFDGLVFTDALNMAGVRRNRETSAIALRAVLAGADILLQPTEPEVAIDAIAEGVARGHVTTARLDASVRRILRAKASAGLLDDAGTGTARSANGDTGPSNGTTLPSAPMTAAELTDTIAARSIALLRDSAALLPVNSARPVLSLTYGGGTSVPGGANEAFDSMLRRAGVRVDRRMLSPRTVGALADSLTRAWNAGSTGSSESPPLVVFSSYGQPVPWRGTIGLPEAVATAIERIARQAPVVHVAFGSPYVISSVPSASTVLVGWSGIPAAQRAAARVVLGAAGVSGRLPISLLPEYELGHGIVRLEMAPGQ